MEIDSSGIQSFPWNSSHIINYDYLEAAVPVSEDTIASPTSDFKYPHRMPCSSNIDFPGTATIPLPQGKTEEENVIPLVGSVHHHYPNHSSVRAIHPNSQIFRSCYPDTPYSTGGGHDILLGRHDIRLEWPITPDDITAMDESPKEYPLSPVTTFHPQSGPQQSKQVQIGNRESMDTTNDNGVTSTLRTVLKPQEGLSCEDSGGTKRDSSAISSSISPKTHPHSEFFRYPNLYQRCCAYHPQNKENHRELGFSLNSISSETVRNAESALKFPEKKDGGGENFEENMSPGKRGGELDAGEMKEGREEENSQLQLLQEQVRVLLWALLGSERLSSAARVATCADDSTTTCWSKMPVRDLLSALIGSCGCSDCRPRRSFYELAYTLLNMCPPLSDRLAGGGPEVLTRVVASVYHNDLMPSIRKHGAHFPEGVHNSMVQVAHLETKLDKISQEKSLIAAIPSESQSSKLVELKSMPEKGNYPKLKEVTVESLKIEAEKKSMNTYQRTSEDTNESNHEIIERLKHWLHPHQKLLVDGLVNNSNSHFINKSSSDSKYEVEKEPEVQKDTQIQTNEPDRQMHSHLPVVKRKRGRPPKNEGKSINAANQRKKRTLLWKFLITLLDEMEENHKQRMSQCFLKPQNLSDLKQKENEKTLENQHYEQEINARDRTNETPTVYNSTSCLHWISRDDGIFRILDTTELARKWGYQHKNPNMTYGKMSRAMRTYYQRKVLVPVPRSYNLPKKLVYKFNPLLLKQMSSKLIKK